jgi:hypothetical protein
MFWSMCWQGYISRMDAAYAFGAGTTFLAHLYFGAGSRKARRVQGYSNFYFLFIIWAESLMIPFICMKRYKNKNESYVLSVQRIVIRLYLSSLVLFSVCTVYLSIYAAFRFSIHVKRISSLNILLLSMHSSISLSTPYIPFLVPTHFTIKNSLSVWHVAKRYGSHAQRACIIGESSPIAVKEPTSYQ